MDKATWIGLIVGFGGIIVGNLIEGGHMGSLLQLTAFIIVMAGTLGAVMVSSSEKDLKTGVALAKKAFRKEESVSEERIHEIVECARIVRKENLLALEGRLQTVRDPLLKGVLKNLVDGVPKETIREIFENKIDTEENELLNGAKIWTDAGGFAPTIGIIGAVLGLIHVMGNLTDTSKLGAGIAVAFVATVYGVSSANLVFLPMGNKIKKKVQALTQEKLMVLEGGLLVASDMNPHIIEQKLNSYIHKEA